MNWLFNFFENADELVCVYDIDTSELLYMNHKARQAFGLSGSDMGNMKWDSSFYGGDISEIAEDTKNPGTFTKYKHYNRLLKKHFLVLRTTAIAEGHRYRFELAVDISDIEEFRETLSLHEKLEARVNRGIREAIGHPDPEQSLMIILEFLGKAIKGERSYIFEKNYLGNDANTYEWVAPGVEPQIQNLKNLSPDICAKWYEDFKINKYIKYEDIETMKDSDPKQYQNLKNQDIRSIVVVPLYDEDRIAGFYGVDNPPPKNLDDTLNMLQIVGHFISSMLKRRNIINDLRNMSYCDNLTKLGNRHAMGECIANLHGECSLGIVYCDITGLKKTNDELGHEKGDALICRAADSLRKAFEGYGLFRIGGDELLAICVGIDEDNLRERLEILRKSAMEADVNLATGSVWQPKYENNLQKLVNAAEKLMYLEKSAYYRAAGIDRRR